MTGMTDLETRVRKIITELTAMDADKIKLEDRLREDLGLDSVSSMELVGMLSEEFDIDIELEDAMAVEDVKGIMVMAQKYIDLADVN